MNTSAGTRGGRLVGPLLAAIVVVVGVTVTLLVVGGLRTAERDGAARVMDQRTAIARSAVIAETGRYLDLLRTVAAGVGSNDRFTAADFDGLSNSLAGADLLGATSVAFVVPGAPADVARIQQHWRGMGASGLVLSPQGRPAEHLFSIYTRTLNGNTNGMSGLDVSASSEATAALNEARRTGSSTVSDTYVLLRDRGLPVSRQQLSFAFAAPVYAPVARTGDIPVFRGWIVMGLHGQDFLGGVLGEASQGLLDGELRATNGDGRQVTVAAYTVRGSSDLRRQATFPIANRQWTLITAATSAHLPGAHSSLPDTVLLGGSVLTVTLAGLIHLLASGRSRARARVLTATAELRTAEQEARRQAGLLGAIMASLGDGVGVVDADGAFLLHNPAAKQLLGVADDIDGPDDWQQHYGLYRPDGRTPFPVEELPLVRALRGESSNGVEMLVRNRNRPDGILVSVDGRPLDPSAGQHGAVAVFHDITELRRYEADLSVFAGVVAHDLKAPLAVIRGHGETVLDVLGEQADDAYGGGLAAVDEARATVHRITQAVDRMAALIDTLLAYATSRDAPLRLQPVALGPLVADVVTERTCHRRPTDGSPVPDIYVGPLPDVMVDPAMLRHVVDNLIGNALKYVQPGRGARVDVTAAEGPAGWARLEIADRGIGIPDDDKPDVFESFHRAQSAVGYAGTGLGLAICRRIVERHGGAIGVEDNPGGGTRFHVTLPLAVEAPPVAARPVEARPVEDPAPPAETPHTREADRGADRAALQRALDEREAIRRAAVSVPPAGTARIRSAVPEPAGPDRPRSG